MSTDFFRPHPMTLLLLLVSCGLLISACSTPSKYPVIKGSSDTFDDGAIVSTASGKAVTYEQLVADLAGVQVVYIGETHNSKEHHAIQLRLIQALYAQHPSMSVGMEMFDRSYQHVLDDWSNDRLSREELLRRTHWYANWRFDDELYGPILEFIKANRIPLVALNLPFQIAPKIRVGGIDHLSAEEKKFLPTSIDTGRPRHREYVQNVFNRHGFGGRTQFEDFYMAQCVWEDGMAEAIAAHLTTEPMVVLAGNGHLQYKYGIPERAYKRTGADYRTVYPAAAGQQFDADIADYIWLTK